MKPHEGQPVLTAGKPLGEGRAVMIMIHGRNAGPQNILDLVPHLQHPDFTYLAPAAADHTWYPYSFLTDISRNEPGLSSGLQLVDQLIATAIAHGVPRDQIVLLGFSQGACLAAEYSVRHAERYGGVIVFSGGLIGPPGTVWNYRGTFNATPVFLGCSDIDAHIPKDRVEESAAVFEQMGAAVTLRLYRGMAHMVNDDELTAARAVMNQALGV